MAKTTVKCSCGTVYERETHKLQFRDRDSFACRLCGA